MTPIEPIPSQEPISARPLDENTAAAVSHTLPLDELLSVSSLEKRTLSPEWFLYTELSKYHLGERASSVIDILVSKGRLSVHEINERLPTLDSRSIKRTLVSLIQLRCVKYWEETSPSGKSSTYYYFNEDGLILFLYSGLIIEELSHQISNAAMAAQIVQNILSLGSITVKDYLQNNDSKASKSEISSVFVHLCEQGFLSPLSNLHYMPISDLWNKLYEKEYKALPRNLTMSDLKRRTEAKTKAKQEFQELIDNSNNISKLMTIDPNTSLKAVVGTLPLTINLDRFFKTRRSKQLVQYAKTRIGTTPAKIYSVALKITELKSPRMIDPLKKTGLLQELDEAKAMQEDAELLEEKTPGITFSAIDICKHLPSSIDLRGTLISEIKPKKRAHETSSQQPGKKLKTEDGFVVPPPPMSQTNGLESNENNFNSDSEELYEDDFEPHSISLINSHLKLLASSSIPFLIESRPGVYYVPYTKLIPLLRSCIYDYMLASTLGPSAMRIRRCISENSLVSEKVINSTALMKEKDIRSTIANLVKYDVVEIQEVPRTADRAASRAVFLFRSKEMHAYDFMKQNIAWNIANLHFKKEKLKEENSSLLTKANRDDVKGRETELLLPSELNQLKMVNERELNILARISRLLSLWEVFKLF